MSTQRHLHDLALSRRNLLLSGASLAVLPWLGRFAQGAVIRRPVFAQDPFQLGVASGDPTSDGVVLWTRLAIDPLNGGGMSPESYEVNWEVATDEGFQQITQSGTELATPQLGHSIHVELSGLKPDTWYWYRFHAGDAVSRIGKTRTMPAVDIMPEGGHVQHLVLPENLQVMLQTPHELELSGGQVTRSLDEKAGREKLGLPAEK